ncbi:hypothetical protein NC661_12220 [Aquibacillus koreensis]|uniref:Uncharacterized protein n=1 Tax=Aquibacillus koreensis TaxID=279446 RepID=A0A9X4AK63_9BACI|nr:hypothetical protein [Aquibacillus koreensis]MCT2537833.1 hypothetical protein [Aquibacillus koreensis]MDC3421135.1 hypothetical protein [Aquibacillus koreensis]
MNLINIIAISLTILVWFHPWMGLQTFRKVIGITLFLELFYLIGSYLLDWPFPTPLVLVQLFVVTVWGVVLGIVFSRVWPLPSQKGFERIFRTFMVAVPALGFGMGFQLLLQGAQATQAIYLIFALAAWLGSGHFMRETTAKKGSIIKKSRLQVKS